MLSFDMLDVYNDPIRGKLIYTAPGTGAFRYGGSLVSPSDSRQGLGPSEPVASVNRAFDLAQEGDTIVLMKEGTYQLDENISTSIKGIKMIAWPGLNPLNVSVVGVSGGPAMTIIGQDSYLRGFEIAGDDATKPALMIRGRYVQVEDMSLGGDCSAGLSLNPMTAHATDNKQDASFVYVRRCRIEYVPIGILFDGTIGDFPGPTDCRIEDNWFNQCTTRAIGQTAGAGFWIDGNVTIARNLFGDLAGATEFIKLDNAGNGAGVKNLIADNVYAHAGVGAGQVALTAGGFFHIGNRDKAGFVTAV